MNIVHIFLCGPYNDGWSYHENCLPYYHKKLGSNRVTLITTTEFFLEDGVTVRNTKECEYVDNRGIKIVRLQSAFRDRNSIVSRFGIYPMLTRVIEKEEPDILFVHGLQFLDILKVRHYVKKHKEIRLFIDNHADYVNSARNWFSKFVLHGIVWKLLAHLLKGYTDKFYGVMPSRVDFLRQAYKLPAEKIELLLMGIDEQNVDYENREGIRSRIRHDLEIDGNDFVVISGGKIDKNKNIHLLIDAVESLKIENVKLIIFGSFDREMQEKIGDITKYTRVKYVGWIDASRVYDYYLASDLACFPGTHSVLWEQAVGSGLPAFFKKHMGIDHLDIGGNCVFLYEDSPEEIRQNIEILIDNPEVYKKMRNRAQEGGLERFSYLSIAKQSIKWEEDK